MKSHELITAYADGAFDVDSDTYDQSVVDGVIAYAPKSKTSGRKSNVATTATEIAEVPGDNVSIEQVEEVMPDDPELSRAREVLRAVLLQQCPDGVVTPDVANRTVVLAQLAEADVRNGELEEALDGVPVANIKHGFRQLLK